MLHAALPHCLLVWDMIRHAWAYIPPHGFTQCVVPA